MYEHDADGRLSSSTATLDPEWSDLDVAWLEALTYLEHHEGPHGHPLWEAMSPEADPANPEGEYAYIAGTPVVEPDSGRVEMAASFDWAERAKQDFLDRARGQDPDPLNGIIVPVHRTRRPARAARAKGSPLDRLKQRAVEQAPPPNTDP